MSNLINYAEKELDRIGMTDEDEYNGMMRKHLLHMVKEFSDEGHSGFSASYAIDCLKRLLKFKPLTPLTGEDDEWVDHGHTFQNKRCSSIFKETKDGQAYDIDGKVFWEWYIDPETGEQRKSYYTNKECRTVVFFPYDVPDEPTYEYRRKDTI